MIDIHCHLLPGIDDGPRNWDEALDLCRAMAGNGIRTAVATPHLIDGVYNNVRSRIVPITQELAMRVSDADIGLEVLPGAEVDLSSRLVTTRSDELPTLGGFGKAVLLEMPVAVIPHAMADIIFGANSQGILPVLAHPERNEHVQNDVNLTKEWLDAGAALQIDGDSLLGVWGRASKRCAEAMLQRGLCHALASDAHSVDKRPPRLAESIEKAVELVGEDARKLATVGPAELLSGQVPRGLLTTPHAHGARDPSARQLRRQGKGWFGRLFAADR